MEYSNDAYGRQRSKNTEDIPDIPGREGRRTCFTDIKALYQVIIIKV